MRCRLLKKKSRGHLRKCRCMRWFLFARKTSLSLQHVPPLHAVRYAEGSYPSGRLLILSDNLALVLALCKGRPKHFTLFSVMRRISASGFRTGCVLSFRCIPSELNYSDKVSRLFDSGYDPSKSLLHVLVRLTRSSLARTSNQNCSSPSLMHLDVGEVDLASHIHVPAVSVRSHVPSDDLCNCTGHTAAVSSPRSSVTGEE